MARYEVVATQWSREQNKQIKVIVGRFDVFMNAKLFCDAYNGHYKANAKIVEYREVK